MSQAALDHEVQEEGTGDAMKRFKLDSTQPPETMRRPNAEMPNAETPSCERSKSATCLKPPGQRLRVAWQFALPPRFPHLLAEAQHDGQRRTKGHEDTAQMPTTRRDDETGGGR